ncbi:hypothetical protein CIL03_05630 [Virgibacillus indicus]|uniref:Uncharacterized protein n=1 Tax=Virgibacillus indicus TaxID=2024554 RepID=A0A265NF05_9BACI|nr:hypothetical protein CIL03_05630 [Virgibacillus indicus]
MPAESIRPQRSRTVASAQFLEVKLILLCNLHQLQVKLHLEKNKGYTGQRISLDLSLCIITKGDGRKFHDQTRGLFVLSYIYIIAVILF